ncbi:BTB/POZ domain-containing protein At3g22104-like [Juglans microcarpa x Juglans regia]|uniref:BTB/POZ domain-containing protein At3g22104-like n=1 Tax=Juglans microcarpa x Juglans regia TaxID=2249226 RepID=UPI001B7DE4B1|nr:BTB/POZ domain-containing protein At3g22104-like [Juglans microcarpa x Juglans regia]XP_041009583.1 BTB/POZ domain-containing protein At3g22104-like [Juglans microcarpa x Juglans regia]XP_041009584.1 BTB/POZ domain-containing protein At3g22104-like [Juglans microcarpa x Juglans regia]XP_041009586.1 BTB/POZ domain-containing protein At3g22104-like [Juglans microcarpa x Juglans regia]
MSLLHCPVKFMEMNNSISGINKLQEQTEKSLEEISYWTWSELLVALKRWQDLLTVESSSGVIQRCLDSLAGRLALATEASPCPSTSSQDSSGFRFSCDTKSTESLKTSLSRATWWFDDLLILSPFLVEIVVKSMVAQKLDHVIISRFLLYYHKSKFCAATPHERRKIIETVIETLYTLDGNSVSCKSLFQILRFSMTMNINKSTRNKLESMIGSRLDQSTLDNLLVPSAYGTNYLYDVNLVLRLLKAFFRGLSSLPLKKVASLMDLYIAEVAPDPCLKPSKFQALAMALPDSARDSHDELYSAVDMYLQVHAGLSEEEKLKICCALNYEKLSADVCIHLAQNMNFPAQTVVQVLISQQYQLKSLLHGTNNCRAYTDRFCTSTEVRSKGKKDEANGQVVLYDGKLDVSSDCGKFRAQLQGMQWRVMELEKACRKMQTQMAKVIKSRVSRHGHPRSLPRICS